MAAYFYVAVYQPLKIPSACPTACAVGYIYDAVFDGLSRTDVKIENSALLGAGRLPRSALDFKCALCALEMVILLFESIDLILCILQRKKPVNVQKFIFGSSR